MRGGREAAGVETVGVDLQIDLQSESGIMIMYRRKQSGDDAKEKEYSRALEEFCRLNNLMANEARILYDIFGKEQN